MKSAFPDRTKLHAQIGKIREKLPQLLSFLERLEDSFAASAPEKGIPPESLWNF